MARSTRPQLNGRPSFYWNKFALDCAEEQHESWQLFLQQIRRSAVSFKAHTRILSCRRLRMLRNFSQKQLLFASIQVIEFAMPAHVPSQKSFRLVLLLNITNLILKEKIIAEIIKNLWVSTFNCQINYQFIFFLFKFIFYTDYRSWSINIP